VKSQSSISQAVSLAFLSWCEFHTGKYEDDNLEFSCTSYINHVYALSVQMICV